MKTTTPSTCEVPESKAPRVIALLALATLLLIALTGCKSGNDTTANIDPTGTYTLVSVDGKSVPCNLTHEGAAMTVNYGKFTINTNGTCVSLINFSVAGHPAINREVKASYTLSGAELTMKWERAGVTTGKVNGERFTMNNEGMIFSYQKQSEESQR